MALETIGERSSERWDSRKEQSGAMSQDVVLLSRWEEEEGRRPVCFVDERVRLTWVGSMEGA